MKAEMSFKPMFEITLTRGEFEVLWETARYHYDSVCKAQTIGRGILVIFKEQFEHPSEIEGPPEVTKSCVTWRELNTMAKTLEMSVHLPHPGLKTLGIDLSWAIRRIYQAMCEKAPGISYKIETGPPK